MLKYFQRLLILSVLSLFILFILGFLIFTHSVTQSPTPAPQTKADAIVVLTGANGQRLETAAQLLKSGYGARLLISGAHENTSYKTLRPLLNIPEKLAACCLDIDHARTTRENALKTAQWGGEHGYTHIILVTSAYHMPRAQVYMRTATTMTITPYPVHKPYVRKWWLHSHLWKRLFKEYGKFIFSHTALLGKRL